MNENANVSVLMSVYKKEQPEYLAACLDSMLQQTYQPAEMVLVKDGPLTPELDAVIDRYVDGHPGLFHLVPLEQNVGLGKALAIGVEACRSEWIARMDTDDIATRDRLEKQMNFLAQHPETDIIGSDILEFEGSLDNILAKREVPHTNAEIRQFAKRRNPFNHMTVLYRKAAVLQAGNYQPLNGYEDYYLWVRLLKQGSQAYNLPEVLVYARGGEDMYERRGGWKYFKDGLTAQRKIYAVGLAGPKDFVIRMAGQAVVNLVPNKARGFLYKRVLRKGK